MKEKHSEIFMYLYRIFMLLIFIPVFILISCDAQVSASKLKGEDTAYLIINLNNSDRSRAIGNNGLPIISAENTKISIINDESNEVIKSINATSGTVKVKLKVGLKIKVKATVSTMTADWIGLSDPVTIEKGNNKVDVKISKKINTFVPITYSNKHGYEVVAGNPNPQLIEKVTVNYGDKEISGVDIPNQHPNIVPVFTRDNKGYLYLAYSFYKANKNEFYVYDPEGTEQTLKILDSTGNEVSDINGKKKGYFTFDQKTGSVYFFLWLTADKYTIYKYDAEASDHKNIEFRELEGNPISGKYNEIVALAVYDDTFFLVKSSDDHKSSTLISYKLASTSIDIKDEINLKEKLSPGIDPEVEMLYYISDIYAEKGADENSVNLYCLVSRGMVNHTTVSVGMISEFTYKSTIGSESFEYKDSYGLRPAKTGNAKNSIMDLDADGTIDSFDQNNVGAQNPYVFYGENGKYFYGPKSFIGRDSDANLYIADDGVLISEDKKEKGKHVVLENKNLICKFNTKSKEISLYKNLNEKDSQGKNKVSFYSDSEAWIKPTMIGKEKIMLWNKIDPPTTPPAWPFKTFCYFANNANVSPAEGDKYIPGQANFPMKPFDSSYPVYKFCFDSKGFLHIVAKRNTNDFAVLDTIIRGDFSEVLYDNSHPSFYPNGEFNNLYDIAYDATNRIFYEVSLSSDNAKYEIKSYKLTLNDSVDELSELKQAQIDVNPAPDYVTISAIAADDNNNVFVACKTDTNGSSYSLKIYKFTRTETGTNLEHKGIVDVRSESSTLTGDSVNEDIYDMQVRDSTLYFTLVKTEGVNSSNTDANKIKLSTALCMIENIGADNFSNSTCTFTEKWTKDAGYALTHFISRQDDKLTLASDAFVMDGTQIKNNNKVVFFNLQGEFYHEEEAVCEFSRKASKTATGTYVWK